MTDINAGLLPPVCLVAPANIRLVKAGRTSALPGCYLKDLNSCSTKISREHSVSESILREINEGPTALVSGKQWLEPGEVKEVGLGALTSKCLCVAHNSELSLLDSAMLRYTHAAKVGFIGAAESSQIDLSGHDIERWLLKTMIAHVVSGSSVNSREEGRKLQLDPALDIAALLSDPTAWTAPMGLFSVDLDLPETMSGIALNPTWRCDDLVVGGFWFQIYGHHLFLNLRLPFEPVAGKEGRFHYRPRLIRVDQGGGVHWDTREADFEEIILSRVITQSR